MSSYDMRGQVATYHETPEEVAEAAEATIRYINEGDTMDQPFDLRGLTVFGIIEALRNHDEALHGENATLTLEQRARLEEVEDTVQLAVDNNMHYYPFGESQNKHNIDGAVYSHIAALRGNSGKARIKGRSHAPAFIRTEPDPVSGPVRIIHLDD